MAKKNLILDVDTGIDDAFALLFAARHPEINLLGVTCVDGNTNLKQVVINTLKVLDAAGAAPIPVSKGATRPLIGEPRYAEQIHGSDGYATAKDNCSSLWIVPDVEFGSWSRIT